MTLIDYLRMNEMSATAFAERAGLAASTVTRIINGSRTPSLKVMKRIAAATDGSVADLDDFSPACSATDEVSP